MKKRSKTLKPKSTPNEAHTFKVGDTVRIRQWEDMVSEFGLDDNSDIKLVGGMFFTNPMEYLCGSCFKIKELNGFEVLGHGTNWTITADMIEHIFNKEIGQRYVVIGGEYSPFEVGEIVTLSRIEENGVSYFENESGLGDYLYDTDHANSDVKYLGGRVLQKDMELKDLKRGMKCLRRGASPFIVDETDSVNKLIHYLYEDSNGYIGVGGMDDDLTRPDDSDLDIMQVFDPTLDGWKTIWKRAEPKQVTLERVSDALGYEIEIVED